MSKLRQYQWEGLLGAGMLALLAYLAFRNHGLYPYVFADELSYSMFSRLTPMAEAIVPSYLYLWLFKASNGCGAGFLECARYGNEMLFIASAPFLYLIARRVCSKPVSVVVTMAALCGPINSYTAYFMPESTYFLGFAVLAWASLRASTDPMRLGLAGGVIMGVLALVKVHALFLLPAQCAFVIAACWLQGGPWLRRAAAALALTIAAMFTVRYALGYLLAGDAGLYLMGPLYGPQAQGNSGKWASFIPHAFANLQGHLMGVALMLTVPLALMGYAAVARCKQPRALTELQLYAFLMLGASMGMAVLYTASLYAVEGLRVHMRYYNFTFPLLFIAGAAGLQHLGAQRPKVFAAVLAIAGAAGMLYAARNLGLQFNVLMGDGAEAAALAKDNPYLYPLVALQIAVLAAWLWRPRVAAQLFVFGFLPFFAFQSLMAVRAFQDSKMAAPMIYDQAALFVRDYLPQAERDQLTITGGPTPHLMRAKMQLSAARAKMLHMDEGAPLSASLIPADSKWLLVIGEHAMPPGLNTVIATPAYKLIRLPDPARPLFRIDLSSAKPEMAALAAVEGLSKPEPWGRWSDGPQVTLQFKEALPRKLVLVLAARAFGPNVGKPFVVRVGGQEQRFEAAEVEREVTLRFDTDGEQRTVTVDIPEPANPTAADGAILDGRKLGVGLSGFRVSTVSAQ
jgi:hypothetical protein